MPWRECDMLSERQRFVEIASRPGINMSQLCREFGISRQTGYKWLSRYRAEGRAGMGDRSRRPRHTPRKTALEMTAAVLGVRAEHPDWGGRKSKRFLLNQGCADVPAPSTITAIIKRHGGIDPEEGRKHRPWQRFEMAAPNQLWQMDFKGDFPLADTTRCYPLTVLDDHSRFLLGLQACANQRGQTVQSCLTAIFRHYGLPERLLVDNGTPWSGGCHRCFTQLTVWLLQLDIGVSYARPRHPQTLGKDERLHRTLQQELIQRTSWTSLPDSQPHFDRWRDLYNHQRPHEALDLDVPGEHYRPSPRRFPEKLPAVVYSEGQLTRKVDPSGKISFRNRPIHVGKGFAGQRVAVAETDTDGVLGVYFGRHWIKEIDLRESKC